MSVCRGWTMRSAALVALGLAASPLVAQTAVPDAPPPPASNGVIGPRELQDFSLPGTRVRPSEPAPTAPAPRAPRPTTTTTTPDASTAPRETPVAAAPTARPAVAPTRSAKVSQPRPAAPPPPTATDLSAPPADVSELPATALPAPSAVLPPSAPSTPWWPWLLSLLAAAGAAAFVYFRRQQSDEALAFAGAGLSETVPAAPRTPAPGPAPAPRAMPEPAPVPTPTSLPKPTPPPPPLAGGIVSTAFRPELEFTFTPLSVAIDEAGTAMVVFDLVVHNHGSAPARDVLVEAGMFNAGPLQDTVIGTFFANPRAEGDRIPVIAPMSQIGVRSRVSIAGDRLSPVEMEGRKLLVPLVAFNALYRWSGGETQRSASFLVGRGNNDAAKLAPFALDRGSRAWGDVAARSHSSGLAAA